MQEAKFAHIFVCDFSSLQEVPEAHKIIESTRSFADRLRETKRQVQTIWASMNSAKPDILFAQADWSPKGARPYDNKKLAAVGLAHVPIKADETVFAMAGTNAFKDDLIGPWLKECGVSSLIISGSPSHPCFRSTAESAVDAGFIVHTVHNHLDACTTKRRSMEDLIKEQKAALTQIAEGAKPIRELTKSEVIGRLCL